MNILGIETATDWCGVALIQDGECTAKIEERIPRQHAEKLPLFYEELSAQSNINEIQMDAVAVSIGPGSFTGLRVGLGFAKGLAFAKDLPIIPVPTLQVIAANSELEEQDFSVLLYSHRDVVYKQKYAGGDPKSVEEVTIWSDIEHSGLCIHYGCGKLMDKENYSSVPPSARMTGLLGEKHYDEWVVTQPYDLVPNYISPFELGQKK